MRRGNGDGGEAGGGARLAQLLETAAAANVYVAVSRQCNGPMLGGRRWNHFLNCARELLEQCGYDQRGGKTAQQSQRSKGRHGKTDG
eukprot:SAG31_NODE_2681_length_5262_cov_5.705791_6_plen_87_part_00